jgi:lipoate-protein ligase A
MYHLDLTLETPAANLALDEALLEAAEAGELPGETLRTWESPAPFVVLGRSSPTAEVREDNCRRDGVPILRRPSGGATVVAGPGCLMYALVLDRQRRPELQGIDAVHRFVLTTMAGALTTFASEIAHAGTSDLAIPVGAGGPLRKFSGNSLRVRRRWLLYHGTLLYDFPISRLGDWLAAPARQPEYRDCRSHADFLTNLPATREALAMALAATWDAHQRLVDWPRGRVESLAATRYATVQWNASRSAPAT